MRRSDAVHHILLLFILLNIEHIQGDLHEWRRITGMAVDDVPKYSLSGDDSFVGD